MYKLFLNFRAALDAVSFQTREILESMEADSKYELTSLLVDGGDYLRERWKIILWNIVFLDASFFLYFSYVPK